MKLFLTSLSILIIVLVYSCKTTNNEQNVSDQNNNDHKKLEFVTGQITTIGNEPFTELGIIVNDSTIYALKCDNEVKSNLSGNQGKIFKVYYNEKIDSIGTTKLEVVKFEPVK